jgi:hypothetical protein
VTRGSDVSWPSTYKRGHYRIPPAQSVYFDDVQLRWYMNQENRPLAGTRGQLMDHIAIGVTTMIVVQAFFNISVVLALLPTKGIPLPFISYGGSSLFVMLASVGVLLNISQQTE